MKPPKILNSQNYCSDCGEIFASLPAFDKHLIGKRGSMECADPKRVGLVKDEKGGWGRRR